MKRIVYNKLSGGHSGEAIPVPIPNTEVKLSYADDTDACRERRLLPDFFILTADTICFTYPLKVPCCNNLHPQRKNIGGVNSSARIIKNSRLAQSFQTGVFLLLYNKR